MTITGRNEENLNQTFAALSGSGHQKIVADLTNETELAALIANAVAFDGIVLAAGIVKVLPFRFINKAEMKSLYETNYEAPILLTQGLLKAKKIETKKFRHLSNILKMT